MINTKQIRRLSAAIIAALPAHYERDIVWALKTPYTTAANRYTLLSPSRMTVNIDDAGYYLSAQQEIDLSASASWDTVAGTDYTVAANRAGKDFYIYACEDTGDTPKIVLSANSTTPDGYTASNSRKVGGFHCLCVAVGTIASHSLTDFAAGDVLPASVWDLKWRAANGIQTGMYYNPGNLRWEMIYLASDDGAGGVQSVYNATILDNISWLDFADRAGKLGFDFLTDKQFQIAASGSNEETNITGSTDPGTTGGHVDTAGRRMISNYGAEDCCGALWQWLQDQSAMYDDAVAADWYDLPGSKGSLYRPADTNDVKLIAGGPWANAAHCGSRCRAANASRVSADTSLAGRFASERL